MSDSRLPPGRLEQKIRDHKPLYSEAEAVAEANRCLYCVDAPCISACPTGIDIPTFIRKISTGNVKGSAKTILDANILGYSCARVCPVEVLCAGACVYHAWDRPPIQIGRLQRFSTETALKEDADGLYRAKPATGKRIACIGAGPASIAAAGWLALEGHKVVVYERKMFAGGLNTAGIAPYKMLADDAVNEIDWVRSLGAIDIVTGAEIGPSGSVTPSRLVSEYDAVFLGLGLGDDSRMSVHGEDGPGVHGATALIERIKLDPTLSLEGVRRALVVGGGNTAIDVAHELKLLGVKDVAMVYRRTTDLMSGYVHEMEYAKRHGVQVIENRLPTYVVRGDGGKLLALRVALAKDGRAVPGTEAELACDLVAVAIGQSKATRIALEFQGVRVDDKGRVVVDPATGRTGHPKVWAGGDCVNGGKEVVNAVQEAKLAVRSMREALRG